MHRRSFLTAGLTTSLAALAGCAALSRQSTDPDPTPTPTPTGPQVPNEGFEYFFQDRTGTLGHVAEGVPQNAEEWQVVENTMSESEWASWEDNDRGTAERTLNRLNGPGTIEKIKQKTREIYNNPQEYFEDEQSDQLLENDHPAELFTRSLVMGAAKATNVSSSGGADKLVNALAEP